MRSKRSRQGRKRTRGRTPKRQRKTLPRTQVRRRRSKRAVSKRRKTRLHMKGGVDRSLSPSSPSSAEDPLRSPPSSPGTPGAAGGYEVLQGSTKIDQMKLIADKILQEFKPNSVLIGSFAVYLLAENANIDFDHVPDDIDIVFETQPHMYLKPMGGVLRGVQLRSDNTTGLPIVIREGEHAVGVDLIYADNSNHKNIHRTYSRSWGNVQDVTTTVNLQSGGTYDVTLRCLIPSELKTHYEGDMDGVKNHSEKIRVLDAIIQHS
jgi:hypothetical protein